MTAPFTAEQFLSVIKDYNNGVFPSQLLFLMLAVMAIFFAVKPQDITGKVVGAILSFLWLWMGMVYHLVYFTAINTAAYGFAFIFIIQGILFLNSGVIKNKLSFRIQGDIYGFTGLMMIFFALVVYPVLGYLYNHIYPYSPTFGLPCPTTIFTFGVLLLSDRKIPMFLLLIPFAWSVIGFTAAFQFGIKEDISLLITSVIALPMLYIRNRNSLKYSLN